MAERDLSENPVRELIRRFAITFFLGVVVYRLGIYVPIPGLDVTALGGLIKGTGGEGGEGALQAIVKYANMFNGGAIGQGSILGLGVTPYISASIIIQLLTFSIPTLKQLQKDGEGGRRKINQYTRYATLVIALIQSGIAAFALTHPIDGTVLVTMDRWTFIAQSVLVITTGSMLTLWLAEQITKFGIGNGVSLIIMFGILAYMPTAFQGVDLDLAKVLGLAAVAVLIIAAIVVVVQAVRRINLEQQRRVQGNKVYGGGQTTLPLKLNQANVIPVIFASPVLMLLSVAVANLDHLAGGLGVGQLFTSGEVGHRYAFAGLIVAFTFFYISITFDLNDVSNHFKQAGFFIRGVKPGKSTVDHIAYVLHRVTFVGAIFLALIAILPEMLGAPLGLDPGKRNVLLGGTGLLIVVGVTLDVIQKVGSFLLAHQYQGLTAASGSPKKAGKRF